MGRRIKLYIQKVKRDLIKFSHAKKLSIMEKVISNRYSTSREITVYVKLRSLF